MALRPNSSSGGTPGGSAGGDLGGTYPNPTVISLADVTNGTLGTNLTISKNSQASLTLNTPDATSQFLAISGTAESTWNIGRKILGPDVGLEFWVSTHGAQDAAKLSETGALVLSGAITATATTFNTVAYAWPASQGSASTFLKNDGSGNLTWNTVVTAAAGNSGDVQYNSGGSFAGSDNHSWDNTNKRLGIGVGLSPAVSLDVIGQLNLQDPSLGALPNINGYNGSRLGVIQLFNQDSVSIAAIGMGGTNTTIGIWRQDGTTGAETALVSGEVLGEYTFGGSTAANTYKYGVQIVAFADGNWSSSSAPAYLAFYTTTSGATSVTEKMRLTNAGRLGLGVTGPSYALDVSGDINLSGTYRAGGTAGVTAGPFTTITSITVKNGIVTALTGS